jgi:putative membrane protein
MAAHAHGGAGDGPRGVLGWDVLLAVLLGTALLLYVRGVMRLWRSAGRGRGASGADVARFVLGWAVLAAALLSPIDAVADRSFALHMLQHELLMVVAAPLLVLGRPLEAWAWALSPGGRRATARIARLAWVRIPWRVIAGGAGAWCAHAAALWIWHVPTVFDAALHDVSLHVLQHACFFASALLFWWSVWRGRRGGAALLALFTTMLHTGALGALLTFAPPPWYLGPGPPALLGLSALEDQQLGGLLMWVPGGLAYLIAALVVVARWLAPARSPAMHCHSAKVVRTCLNDSSELSA